MDKQKIALWGVGVFGSLGLLILVIQLLSKTNRWLEQPLVKMPVPEGIIVNAQNQAIDNGIQSFVETQSGKIGRSPSAHGDRSSIASAAIPPVTTPAPISSRESSSSVTIGSKSGTQDIASSTEFSILSANHLNICLTVHLPNYIHLVHEVSLLAAIP
jgi:hypothetical protein